MSLDLYPAAIHTKTVSATTGAYASEIDKTCEKIRSAIQGSGTDTKLILKVMGSMDLEERCVVPARYKERYGKELLQAIHDERQCSGDFATALGLLAVDPVAAECAMLDAACKNVGTNESLILSIVCGRSNAEMEILKKKYLEIHQSNLAHKLKSELSGDLEKLVLGCLEASEEVYDPNDYHTEQLVLADAEALHTMGQARLGTDEEGIFCILCRRPPRHLERVNALYHTKYGQTLLAAMEREFSGHVQAAVLCVLGMKLEPYRQVARLIKEACRGFGTNELLLTATLIRYQFVLRKVLPVHYDLFHKTVRDRVNSETSGDYRRLLLEVIETAESI